MQGVLVRSLVRELRSHMPCDHKTKNVKQKQYCNKFTKDFKNGPHKKKPFKTNKQTNKQNTSIWKTQQSRHSYSLLTVGRRPALPSTRDHVCERPGGEWEETSQGRWRAFGGPASECKQGLADPREWFLDQEAGFRLLPTQLLGTHIVTLIVVFS